MGWAEGSIKSYAENGEVTAEVVKTSLLNMADETNAAFETMPITFSQAMTDLRSTAVKVFQPVLQRLNDLANSQAFQTFAYGAIEAMATLANILLNVFDYAVSVGTFIGDNWSIIEPIVYGIVAALTAYLAVAAIVAAINGIMATAATVHAAAEMIQTGATFAATAAQYGLNAALMACPLTWIILLIIAVIVALVALCNWIAEVTGEANSGIGIIVGALAVAAAFIGNLFVTLINMVIDVFAVLWNFIAAFANFFGNVFTDPVGATARLFFDLVDCILSLLQTLASALDTIFGSNLSGAVQGWRDDLGGWVDETFGQGEEIMATVNGQDMHVDRFNYGDAWNAGTAFGDDIADKISNFSLSDIFGQVDIPDANEYTSGFNDVIANAGIGDDIGSIADDTGAIKDSMDITQEDLKYLRDIAERDAIDKYTIAEVHIEQNNTNTINSGDDIDGFMTKLTDSVNEAVDNMTEGVHD